ncbi:hypothetical protein [Sphaerisporangium fuscum]|uniref:hypothetical protein n=1 Tax=Sphaerisporangium fuscum TaxID=2835868 RepID=UPI001BDC4C2D|nr:hypothetical protein [Sphaerisporangium fuscum]
MTDQLIPQERDLPAARRSQRRAHLMSEIARTTQPHASGTPAPARPWYRRPIVPRLAVTAAAAVVLTAGAVAGTAVFRQGASTANAAVVCSTDKGGDFVVARIVDPYADQKRLNDAFRACGFDIELKLVPASPSVERTIVMMDGEDGLLTVDDPSCTTASGGSCPIGLRIKKGFHGHAMVVVGREARPGEQYASTNTSTAKGEALEGARVDGITVAQAESLVRRKGLTVARYNAAWTFADGSGYGAFVPRSEVGSSWKVSSIDPFAPGQVMLMVKPEGPMPPEIKKKMEQDRQPTMREPVATPTG